MMCSYFLRQVVPVAEEVGVRMAIHPDDPPFSLFGLHRIVSTHEDVTGLLEACPSPANGITMCVGTFASREDNNVEDMVAALASKIHFIHLRNVTRTGPRTFVEDNHLDGMIDMYAVIRMLLVEQQRRKDTGRTDTRMPFRPDHGHAMLDDLKKKFNPGYPGTGRLRGLGELRGVQHALLKMLAEQKKEQL